METIVISHCQGHKAPCPQHPEATNPLGTASAQTRMSRAAVEMKLRFLVADEIMLSMNLMMTKKKVMMILFITWLIW